MYTAGDIHSIEKLLGRRLPRAVLDEARDPNSPLWAKRDAFRFSFMGPGELRCSLERLADEKTSPLAHLPEAGVLWADDAGNYLAVFLKGPVKGRICLLGYDTNLDSAPIYRTVSTLAEALRADQVRGLSEWPYRVDYPNVGDEVVAASSHREQAADLASIGGLRRALRSNLSSVRRRFLYSSIASLTPRKKAASLVPQLEDPDYHICGRACRTLGYHGFEPACARLAAIASAARNPARFYAVDGLGYMRSGASLEALRSLVLSGKPLPGNIVTALRNHRCECRTAGHPRTGPAPKWHVRFLEERKWHLLRLQSALRPVYWWTFGIANAIKGVS
jgi:hypothetical protein